MEGMNELVPRVRMNFSQDAKGFVKMDLTVEMPSVKETAEVSRTAIDEYKAICQEKGIRLLEPPAA